MTAFEIITIGDELLKGTRVNTNAAWIARNLADAGGRPLKITTVADDPTLISSEIERVINGEPDLLVLTGGLGPTPDDRTLDALSQALDVERKLDSRALKMIEKSYSRLSDEGIVKEEKLTPARESMAKLPEGSKPIPNPVGGAPAVMTEARNTKIFCLPGVPEEMMAILEKNLDDIILEESGVDEYYLDIDISNVDESVLVPLYDKIGERFSEVEIHSYPECCGLDGEISVKISGDSRERLLEAENYFRELIRDLEGAKVKDSNIDSQ